MECIIPATIQIKTTTTRKNNSAIYNILSKAEGKKESAIDITDDSNKLKYNPSSTYDYNPVDLDIDVDSIKKSDHHNTSNDNSYTGSYNNYPRSGNYSTNTVGAGDVYVEPYIKSDGTVVQGHYRTQPNSTTLDNYSHKGNINPYTGKRGYSNY